MSERYRLIFRGEALEGQHPAVVKQRLGTLLKLDAARLDVLFTGKAVTIRKDADADTAAKFQIAFKRAGARLRVVSIDPYIGAQTDAMVKSKTDRVAESAHAQAAEPEGGGLRLAPRGATLAEPRPAETAPATVDVSHMTLAAPGALLGTPSTDSAVAPDVAHLTVAAPGADLGAVSQPPPVPVNSPEWEIARVGVELVAASPAIDPPLDADAIEFDLAPPGALMADADDEPAPAAPDISHLKLE